MGTALDPAVVIIVGAFIPVIIAVINRFSWSSQVKALVDLVVIVAVGVGVAYLLGARTAHDVMIIVAAVYGLAQAAFHGVWQPTGAATTIEAGTG